MRTKIIETRLCNLVKSGYIPQRGNQELSSICYSKVNCFAYAGYNMTNEKLEELHWNDACAKALCCLTAPEQTLNFLSQTYLKVDPDNDKIFKLAKNQWRVALFLGSGRYPDKYHYMLQQPDGTWSEKRGFYGPERSYNNLPQTSMGFYEEFSFNKTYIITNPYAEK